MELASVFECVAGGSVEGVTGQDDRFEAIRRTIAEDHYDEIVISTLPTRVSKGLRRDLPRRVEALGVPVTVITAGEGDERPRDDESGHLANRYELGAMDGSEKRYGEGPGCRSLPRATVPPSA